MEKIVEDLDTLLNRMDILVKEIKDTASDMAELMDIVTAVPENLLQVKDIFKRQCMMITSNVDNYKIDSLQIKTLIKEKSGKTNVPSCSSDEQMMDMISEKEEKIDIKGIYSFRPQSDKTSTFEKIIQNPIIQDPVEIQVLMMKELYNLASTDTRFVDFKGVYPRLNYLQYSNPNEIRYWYEFGAINSIFLSPPDFPEVSKMPQWLQNSVKECYQNNPMINYRDQLVLKFLSAGPDFHDQDRYPAYHFMQLVKSDDIDNHMETFRKSFYGFNKEGIRIRRAIGLRIILTTMETTLKKNFRTYGGESKFSPIMVAAAKKSPPGAIMFIQQRMKMIERGVIKSSPDAQEKFCVQRHHESQGGGICPACSKNKEITLIPDD